MFFFWLIQGIISDSTYFSLSSKIGTFNYCSKTAETVEIYPPINQRFLFVINRVSPKTQISVSSPPTSPSVILNISKPALHFPDGNAKVLFKMDNATCFSVSYAAFPETTCVSGIKVITESNYQVRLNTSKHPTDECIFYCPADDNLVYNISDTYLNTEKITVFHEIVDGVAYETLRGNGVSSISVPSKKPWLIRLETKASCTDVGIGANLNLKSNPLHQDAVLFIGYPYYVASPTVGTLESSWIIPILGSVSPFLLLASWIYTMKHLYSKDPVEGTVHLKDK